MTDYPTREQVDDQYTWDLTRIYETPADWEADHEQLRENLDTLRAHEQPTASPTALSDALEAIADALVTKSRLELYAQLSRNEDTTDDDRRDRQRRARQLAADVDEAVQTVRRRIQRDATTARESIEDPALDGWQTYLEDILSQAAHTRDAGAEAVIAAFEPVVETQTDTIVAITTEDVEPPTVEGPDGKQFEVDKNTYREALDHPDRAFRRRAHQAFFESLGEHEHALAAAIGEKVQAHAALAEARNYDSVREMALSRASYPDTGIHMSLSEETHDAVIDGVRQQLDAYHDLLESRRECLGVETLRPWDTNIPLTDGEPPELSYADVREHVLAAVEPLGEDYRDTLETFLDERRVDLYPTERKRTDIPAYCPSSPDAGAFVLANFREDLRTAFFLAHELGHAMHIEHLRDAQPPRYVTNPQPVSEIPSIVHELLLTEHLLENGDPELAPFVRERRAEFLSGNVYGAGQSAAFLHEVYQLVEDGGDLTPDRLAETYAEVANEFHGPIEADVPGVGWRRQAYAREPYHNYQYVIGAMGAVSVFQRIQSGALSTDAYRDVLRQTGRQDAESSFEELGIDVTAAEPYERVADELDRIRTSRLQ
jgi:oligoendopeptidase F